MADPLEAAVAAHKATLSAQVEMRRAARERDAAVRAARAAGIPAAELAAALGVNRHRIHAILKGGNPLAAVYKDHPDFQQEWAL